MSEPVDKIPKENGARRMNDPKTGKFVEGNPGGGRHEGAGISITTEIKRKLKEIPPDKKHDYLHYLIEQILKKAIVEGDQQMIKQIWNYIDGMPPESHDFTSKGEKIGNVDLFEYIKWLKNKNDDGSNDNGDREDTSVEKEDKGHPRWHERK